MYATIAESDDPGRDRAALEKISALLADLYGPAAGLIIVAPGPEPAADRYLAPTGFWHAFGAATEAENPRTYGGKQLLPALAAARAARPGAVAAMWIHPDVPAEPNETYLKMSGARFPGSPRH